MLDLVASIFECVAEVDRVVTTLTIPEDILFSVQQRVRALVELLNIHVATYSFLQVRRPAIFGEWIYESFRRTRFVPFYWPHELCGDVTALRPTRLDALLSSAVAHLTSDTPGRLTWPRPRKWVQERPPMAALSTSLLCLTSRSDACHSPVGVNLRPGIPNAVNWNLHGLGE